MSRSKSKGKLSPIFSAKPRAAGAPSPTLTASTANGRPCRLSWSEAMLGISSRQGVHQVAQKLSSTTFPWYSDRRCILPCTSSSASAGVALPFHGLSNCAAAGKANTTRIPNAKLDANLASLIELLYRKRKARRVAPGSRPCGGYLVSFLASLGAEPVLVLPDFALVDFDLDDLAFFVSFFASIFESVFGSALGAWA